MSSVISDSKAGTRDLLAAVRKAGYRKTGGRRAAIREATAAAQQEIQKVQPQMAYLNILREVLPDNAIVTDELSQVGFASWYGFPIYEPRTFITSGYQGTLGSGFPTALGAKVANPDKPVVAITGDGGFMFGVQELSTAVQFNIGVVTLVFNNNAYGNVRRDQRTRFDGRVVAADLVNPDFVKLAEILRRRGEPRHRAGSFQARAGEGAGPWRAISDRGRSAQGFGSDAVDVHSSGAECRPSGMRAAQTLIRRWRRRKREQSRPYARFPERQVDALAAEQRVLAIGERRHAVKGEPRRAAPDHDVAMHQTVTHRPVCTLQPPHRKVAGRPSDTDTIGAS